MRLLSVLFCFADPKIYSLHAMSASDKVFLFLAIFFLNLFDGTIVAATGSEFPATKYRESK